MIETWPKAARRALALGLLAMALAGLWFLALAPVIAAYQANTKAILEAQAVLARYQAVAAYQTTLDGLGKVGDQSQTALQTLPGDSDAIALAGLQSTLQTIAASNGAQIQSAQALPQLQNGVFEMIGVQIDMAGDLAAIQHTLHKIETATPFLFVIRADLRKREGAPEQAAFEPVILDTQLDIYGARPAKAAAGTAP